MRTRTLAVAVCVLVVLAGCSAVPSPSTPVGDGTESTPTPPEETPVDGADEPLEVHFVNVGQSVATLVIGPTGETMLVDSGHYEDDGEHVLAHLRDLGIDRIDHLVTSHGHADHIGGHAAVIEHYETEADGVGAVYDPGIAASTRTYEAYLDAVETHGVDLLETREGDAVPMAGVDVRVLGPPEPYLAGGDRNENSIVLKLTLGDTSFLLTGDAEGRQEEYLVEEYGSDLRSTVLKAGHHGSRSSTSGALLDAVEPRAVVVSSADDSQYGHPHEAVLDRLADRDVPAYWTATHGDVVLVSDGRTVRVDTQRAAPTDPRRLREGDPVAPGTAGAVQRHAVIDPDAGVATDSTPTATAVPGATADKATATEATATDGGTPQGELELVEIHEDAEGDDRENLNDEYVVFENEGSEPLDLSGWRVSDEADKTYTFPDGAELPPGERVTLRTGSGEDTATDHYWGAGSPVWNNGGDTVTVRDDDGHVVLEEGY